MALGDKLTDICITGPLEVVCCFTLASFNIFNCLQFSDFDYHGILAWVYPVCDSLSFLNLEVYVFCQICEGFGHYFFKYFFSPIFPPFPDSDNTNVNSFFIIVHCP